MHDTPSFVANYFNSLTDAEAIRQLANMGIKFEPKDESKADV